MAASGDSGVRLLCARCCTIGVFGTPRRRRLSSGYRWIPRRFRGESVRSGLSRRWRLSWMAAAVTAAAGYHALTATTAAAAIGRRYRTGYHGGGYRIGYGGRGYRAGYYADAATTVRLLAAGFYGRPYGFGVATPAPDTTPAAFRCGYADPGYDDGSATSAMSAMAAIRLRLIAADLGVWHGGCQTAYIPHGWTWYRASSC